jgi:hypothetical protein
VFTSPLPLVTTEDFVLIASLIQQIPLIGSLGHVQKRNITTANLAHQELLFSVRTEDIVALRWIGVWIFIGAKVTGVGHIRSSPKSTEGERVGLVTFSLSVWVVGGKVRIPY